MAFSPPNFSGVFRVRRFLHCGKFRLAFAYNPVVGEMKRANAWKDDRRREDRFASPLVIAASIIAAVRLAREEHIGRTSTRVFSAVADAVSLARMILDKIVR